MTFSGLPPVDRRIFIPDVVWVVRDHEWVRVSRGADPDEWARVVAADDAIVVGLKDGIWPTSSSSAPWLMAQMIRALRLEPGMKVLEIGTGPGFNAACMSALGADVVSIEIDAQLAEQARANLRTAGCENVAVLSGDGELGSAENAPFDRVIATAAAHTIPYTWVEQTRDGGLIVAPYTGKGHGGAMLVLTVSDGVARGRADGDASFMPLRGQKMAQSEQSAINAWPDLYVEVGPAGQSVTAGRD
jgi:protein-L-isoaspartate(D-aspartate) O-methyltransferase